MSAVRKLEPITADEYLAFEDGAETRHEYVDGKIVAMAGASIEHNRLIYNLTGELFSRLRGGPCVAYINDQRMEATDSSGYYYPDLAIVCGPPQIGRRDRLAITNPRVVIEVISASTEIHDRVVKFRKYQQIESIREIVFVDTATARLDRYVRREADWSLRSAIGLEETLRLESIDGVEIPLADLYRGITFEPAPGVSTAD